MTIIFGNLTTSFVGYASATMNGDPAALQAAQNDLFDSVDTDALYLVSPPALLSRQIEKYLPLTRLF